MKIGTQSSPYSGNNVNITFGRVHGVDVNSAFVAQAFADSALVVSGTVAIWDDTAINEKVKLPLVSDLCATTATDTSITENRHLLVAVLEGADEAHNTHISAVNGVPLTVANMRNIEIEMPITVVATASSPQVCIQLATANDNYGKLVYDDVNNDSGTTNVNVAIKLTEIKVTGLNTTKGIVRFICL